MREMLLKLGEEIRECYRHATDARQKADAAADPGMASR